ncbi:ankyrin repeat domain-containing protein 39-like [Clytia hemisphaerica]|uniref:ankyrin repeat domain-containing protein 39-like n=1 Tax=Clytia hemisphaerica TaxID=252671 RepID=UPI0034D5ABE2
MEQFDACSSCEHSKKGTPYDQSLDEMEFQRGIWQAAIDNDINKIKRQYLNGTDINSVDSSGYTALHYASRNGHNEIVNLLIGYGACVNCVTKAGKDTPLHRAVYVGNLDIVRLLISAGASIRQQNVDGQTSLHKAVQRNHTDVVRYLLKMDSEIQTVKDNKSKLPIDYSSSEEMTNLLKIYKY